MTEAETEGAALETEKSQVQEIQSLEIEKYKDKDSFRGSRTVREEICC